MKELWDVTVQRKDGSLLRFDHNPTLEELPLNEPLAMYARVTYLNQPNGEPWTNGAVEKWMENRILNAAK